MNRILIGGFVFKLSIFCTGAFAAPVSESERQMAREKISSHYHEVRNKAVNKNRVRVLVKYKDDYEADADGLLGSNRPSIVLPAHQKATNNLQSSGLFSSKVLPRFNMGVYEVNAKELDELLDSGEIAQLYEDRLSEPNLIESIPHIGADDIHGLGFLGAGTAVAVLDTGVDLDHRFLGGRVVREACFSSDTDDAFSLCPNGEEEQIGIGAGQDCFAETGIASCFHGTHVTGIAAGLNAPPSFPTFSGVAPFADIISVQVFSGIDNSDGACGEAEACLRSYSSDQIAALDWLLSISSEINIAAVNMSLGTSNVLYVGNCDGLPEKEAIDELREAGVTTVIASGNNGFPGAISAPGCISSAITVASTGNADDVISAFSNRSAAVDVLAPGEDIVSSSIDNSFATASGTSMAAPHVAGAIALLREINPHASVDYIEDHMKRFSVPVFDEGTELEFPRLDVSMVGMEMENKPIAAIEAPSFSVIINREYVFGASESADPNDLPLTYAWDFADGAGVVTVSTDEVAYEYTEMGTYDISLSVDNGIKNSAPVFAKVTAYDPAIISIIVNSILL